MKTESLAAKGFVQVMATPHGEAWVRIFKKDNWILGEAIVHFEGFVMRVQAAADLQLARLEVLGQIADNPALVQALQRKADSVANVSGKGWLKGLGKKFREKLNVAARKVAKMKVLNQLRKTYAKVLDSPIADMGVALGARALSAFGVPAAATKAAINQRRHAQIDRLKHGGWAGMIERATGKEGLKGVLKEAAKRNLEAGKKAVLSALPGGAALGALQGVTKGIMKTSGEDDDDLPCDCRSTGYENIWELGHYG